MKPKRVCLKMLRICFKKTDIKPKVTATSPQAHSGENLDEQFQKIQTEFIELKGLIADFISNEGKNQSNFLNVRNQPQVDVLELSDAESNVNSVRQGIYLNIQPKE